MQTSNLIQADSQKWVPQGRVYIWYPSDTNDLSSHFPSGQATVPGEVRLETVPLLRLKTPRRLCGQYVSMHNASILRLPGENSPVAVPLGNVCPDVEGNFCFDPCDGGGRAEKNFYQDEQLWQKYIQASRFGEVNSYYHLDRVAHYIDQLLRELGLASLPPVVVKVNAHNAVGEVNGQTDGVLGKRSGKWYPMQGGHYRLPTSKTLTVKEHYPLTSTGEIHLGPGWRYARAGALVDHVQAPYRSNASHNAGTLYHEYGHHLTRHTADFRANGLSDPHDQCNYKTESDEAFCDYLAASMMNSPHIWAFHHRHDHQQVHPRSLVSKVTMDDYCHGHGADAHANGTILAATLWNLRQRMLSQASSDQWSGIVHDLDLMVVHALVLIGQVTDHPTNPTIKGTRKFRKGFGTVRQALLFSCRQLFENRYRESIRAAFAERKIGSRNRAHLLSIWRGQQDSVTNFEAQSADLEKIKSKTRQAQLPSSNDLLTANEAETFLTDHRLGPYCLVAIGDVMLGSRARHRTEKYGGDYIFHATRPLFRRAAIVLGNQEGPIARHARKQIRNHSYKVSPKFTSSLKRAGINVLNLANNHLLDCGREGVIETLNDLRHWGIDSVGAGRNRELAHRPIVRYSGQTSIGILGYYWNRRTAATDSLAGSAKDTAESLKDDISRLRNWVDRVVVNVHWGVPYQRYPDERVREQARLMIDLGADLIIGHHPHIVQPIELMDGKPVIYSIGNFAFGTGNSRAESMVVAVNFNTRQTIVDLFPAYVKNRDPRINYQPKLMIGTAGTATIEHLKSISPAGQQIEIREGFGRLICETEASPTELEG